jgi:Mo-co oxidoreductase dimerisation domain
MVPRSFITNIKAGETVPAGAPTLVRGIAFGGDTGVGRVDLSSDGGTTWRPAELGRDAGKYGFRRWENAFTFPAKGPYTLMVRCTNSDGVAQPDRPNWNPSGFMRNVIEATPVVAG